MSAIPDLTYFDFIVVSTSAGKDSQTMLDVVHQHATAQGVADRVVAVHCDLGRVEWQGTRALAEQQADHYGVRFIAISRPQGDLLDHVESRGMWPDNQTRYCTSDHKRGQVWKVFTQLAREGRERGITDRRVRILNCIGYRAQESASRKAKLDASFFENKGRPSNKTVREVWDWYPIIDWSEEQVWQNIELSGVPYHEAYDHGMPRLSCVFCIYASRDALLIAGEHNPQLLDAYCQVEQKIEHTFGLRVDSITSVRDALRAGERGKRGQDWSD